MPRAAHASTYRLVADAVAAVCKAHMQPFHAKRYASMEDLFALHRLFIGVQVLNVAMSMLG